MQGANIGPTSRFFSYEKPRQLAEGEDYFVYQPGDGNRFREVIWASFHPWVGWVVEGMKFVPSFIGIIS